MSKRQSKYKPPHWPAGVDYIAHQCYHSSIPASIKAYLTQSPPSVKGGSSNNRQSFRQLVAVREISDETHPARGQYGLFAAKKIPSRTHIIDYVGEVHCEARLNSDYDLSLYRTHDGISVGVDASNKGNEARFINDYRGIKPKPNAVFMERRTETGELYMSVWSGSEDIRKGEEILVSYGKGFWSARASEV